MFRVQYMATRNSGWTGGSIVSSESVAIREARRLIDERGYYAVRVVDSDGDVVWSD